MLWTTVDIGSKREISLACGSKVGYLEEVKNQCRMERREQQMLKEEKGRYLQNKPK